MAQSSPHAELPTGEAAFKFLKNILAPLAKLLEASKNAVQKCVDLGLGLSPFRGSMIVWILRL
jgi:hypothetical protein